MSTWNTEASVFPAATIPDENFKVAYGSNHRVIPHVTTGGKERRPSDEEQLYIIGLHKWAKDTIHLPASMPIPSMPRHHINANISSRDSTTPGNKFRLLKDVSDNAYYDLVGEIAKTWRTDLYTTIYFTDYTPNKQVQPITTGDEPFGADRDGDPHGYTSDIKSRKVWTGPIGQLCLQIFLWPPHSRWANDNLVEGDFVFIRNVRIGTRNNNKYLRADLNEDQRNPDQIDIRKINHNDKRCRDMISRRENYWVQREQQPEKRLSKKQKRRLEKKLRAQEAAKSGQADNISDKENEESNGELPHKKPSALRTKNENGEIMPQQRLEIKTDSVIVVCAHSDKSLISVTQVLDTPSRAYTTPHGQMIRLPFINQNFRIRVRVIDFWPSRLEDFSRKVLEHVDGTTQDDSQAYSNGSQKPRKWEWAFGLLVEDAEKPPFGQEPAKMSLIVSGMDAEYLLKLNATE